MIALALSNLQRYGNHVTVNPVTEFGDSRTKRRTSVRSMAGAFFVPAMLCHGGRVRETFGSAGVRLARFANPRTAATYNCLAIVRGSSTPPNGAVPHEQHLQSIQPRRRMEGSCLRCAAFQLVPVRSPGPVQPSHEPRSRSGKPGERTMTSPDLAQLTTFHGDHLLSASHAMEYISNLLGVDGVEHDLSQQDISGLIHSIRVIGGYLRLAGYELYEAGEALQVQEVLA